MRRGLSRVRNHAQMLRGHTGHEEWREVEGGVIQGHWFGSNFGGEWEWR